MNLTEQKFWKQIKESLPGDVCRVENYTDDGMPDINGTCVLDYWIELKVCDNKAKTREVTKMLRDSQIVWHLRRGKQGALIFVIVRYPRDIMVYKFVVGLGYQEEMAIPYASGFYLRELTRYIIKTITERVNSYGKSLHCTRTGG